MNKQKWFQWAAITLLLANTALVVFMLAGSPRPPKHRSPKEEIISLLHLDEQQQARFENLIQEHQLQMRALMERMLEEERRYYKDSFLQKDSILVSSRQSLSLAHQEWEDLQVKHLSKIKSICREDQMVYFNELVSQFPQFFQPPHP
jgi:hypothetical protein